MILNTMLTKLTEKQRRVWRMRHEFGWDLGRIAQELGTCESAVCQILQRARRRAGLPVRRYTGSRAAKPRWVQPTSLSSAFNY